MRLDEPGWWYAPPDTWPARLLMPAAILWGHIAERRFAKAVPIDFGIPVICIGNFTAGGTGKTPLSLHFAATLQRMGHAPVFLTRGYGGRQRGPHWVDADRDSAVDVGDEPLLLARHAPVMLARDRAAGASAIGPAGRGDVIIMDDGLQNPSLAKDLTIAVVDGRRGIGNGRVIPAGPLRAPLAAQLQRVDAVVINRPALPTAIAASDAGAWFRQHFDGPVLDATTAPAGDTSWLKTEPVHAYAAIGAPQRFFDMLRSLDANVIRETVFPDHHAFSEREAAQLLAAARAAGAILVTTEKDSVRLDTSKPEQKALKAKSRMLAITMVFTQSEQQQLEALIESALAARTGRLSP